MGEHDDEVMLIALNLSRPSPHIRYPVLARKVDWETPVMRSAREARMETESWSDARKAQAKRIVNSGDITTPKEPG